MRGWYLLLIMVSALSLLVLVGCKDGMPSSELDLFIEHMESLDAQTQADSLAVLAAGEGKRAAYANYMMGNKLYATAADSAGQGGWSTPVVTALLDESEEYLNRAVAQDSSFVEALVNLGSLWDDRSEIIGPRNERDGKMARAKEYYEMAIVAAPHDEKAHCNLGSLYLRQRKTSEAKDQFQSVLDHNPRSSLAHYNMAIMFAEAKIYREAIREWEMAVKYDPDGDIGQRSKDNIQIVKDLMNSPDPSKEKPQQHSH